MLCYLALDAWAGRVPSWKRVTTAIDGCTPWNMRSFFAVQMVRQRRVIIFMNIGVFDFLLRLLITSKIVVGACIWTCIDPSKKLPNDIERKVCKSFFTARAAEFTIIIEPCFFFLWEYSSCWTYPWWEAKRKLYTYFDKWQQDCQGMWA